MPVVLIFQAKHVVFPVELPPVRIVVASIVTMPLLEPAMPHLAYLKELMLMLVCVCEEQLRFHRKI